MGNQNTFGTRLRGLRRESGLTLRELANKVDISFTYLSKIESGSLPPPSEKVIRRLGEALHYDQDELLALAGIIPPDIAEILKDRRTREKLRSEQAKKESARMKNISLPRFPVPVKAIYRLALPVFLVVAIAVSIWFASPTQALQIEYPNQPLTGTLGSSYTFSVKVTIQDAEHLPLQDISVLIYNENAPTSYRATLAGLPLNTSGAVARNPSEGTSSGTATVAAAADASWGYTASATGYVAWQGTGYSFSPATSGGYGYQGGTGSTSITYTIVWIPPSSWPAGTYKIDTVLTTSTQSPGGGTTFTKSSSTFTLSAVPVSPGGGGGGGGVAGVTFISDVVTPEGKFTRAVTARSFDNIVSLAIERDVIGRSSTGLALSWIGITEATSPPAAPEQASIVGLAYNFTPDGATFVPPILVTFSYSAAAVPTGFNEEDLTIAYYDTAEGSWTDIEGITLNTAANTISGNISHFTAFAVIAATAPEPAPAPTVTPTVTPPPTTPPATTPPATTPPATTPPAKTPPATTPPTTTPPVTKPPTATPPATTPPTAPVPPVEEEAAVNWWLWGGIIGVVIIVAAVVLIMIRRR
ncbi:MAG: hypothetical protein A2Z29_01185 [Chloroflexi bacterium RBG_16_56_11]|nr:MAG: hypothetical protein A2Z29_01185 [Chloroflexi bacterium RBG_16_56_11]